MADKSEAGWGAVEEYESDELASNSEDDKKIRSAQATAVRKKNDKHVRALTPQKDKRQALFNTRPLLPSFFVALFSSTERILETCQSQTRPRSASVAAGPAIGDACVHTGGHSPVHHPPIPHLLSTKSGAVPQEQHLGQYLNITEYYTAELFRIAKCM